MKKFKKIEWFLMIMSYFMAFLFVGMMFNSISVVMPWSISIFIILYFIYWFRILIIDLHDLVRARIELLKEKWEIQDND